jgi:CHAT domain-containing protein
MIVSLRKVPDKETVELMTEFYSLWTKRFDKKSAFTQAQQKLRQMYPDHPEKWTGFMMIE